jgi:hypothetical protein
LFLLDDKTVEIIANLFGLAVKRTDGVQGVFLGRFGLFFLLAFTLGFLGFFIV